MAAHIVLEELRATAKIVPTLVPRGENKRPEYLAVHPRGFVPVLETADGALTEVVAILLHLAQTHPRAGLLPAPGSIAEARTFEWLAWLTNTVHVAYAGLWRLERFTDDEAAGRRIVDEAKARIAAFDADIERKFEDGRVFAVGDAYTIADPFLFVFFRWANRIGLDAANACPAWTRWALMMEQRPSVAKVLKSEGVSLWELAPLQCVRHEDAAVIRKGTAPHAIGCGRVSASRNVRLTRRWPIAGW
jgi:glutathione S-transferase